MATRAEERRNVSGAQIALVILLLLALLAAVWFFFLRGDGEDTTALPAAPTAPVATPEPTGEARKPGKGPLETFEVFAPKDPFKPAVVLAGTTTGTSGGAANGTTDGTTGGATTGNGTSTGGNGGGRDESVGGHRVRLVDVFSQNGGQRARVQIDGTVYTVREGDRFADNFELLSIEGQCASLLFGDDQFTLCEGEEILK